MGVQALTTTRIVPTGKTGRNYTIPQFTGVIALRFDNLPFPTKLKSPQVFIIWSDLFHSGVPDYLIDEAFKIMEGCERHRFLILTKRSARMQMYVQEHFGDNMLKNVGLGVTVETQRHIVRLDDLLNTAAPMRFISVEPMLGPVTLPKWEGLDWVICGPETGPHQVDPVALSSR